MNKNKGWTIIQTMLALLVAGIAISVIADKLIEYRCKNEPSLQVCARR